jgi:hypothetical protein
MPVHLLYFATLILTLLVLVGILARQLRQAGRLGLAGFLVAFFGTSMSCWRAGSTYSRPTSARVHCTGCGSSSPPA